MLCTAITPATMLIQQRSAISGSKYKYKTLSFVPVSGTHLDEFRVDGRVHRWRLSPRRLQRSIRPSARNTVQLLLFMISHSYFCHHAKLTAAHTLAQDTHIHTQLWVKMPVRVSFICFYRHQKLRVLVHDAVGTFAILRFSVTKWQHSDSTIMKAKMMFLKFFKIPFI